MTEPTAPPTFAATLAGLARGTLNDEATLGLADLTRAVHELDAKGTMTVKLTVEPAGGGRRTVQIAGEVDVKPPKAKPEISLRFVGDGGTLHRDDPYQPALRGLPHVDADGVIKIADPASGELRELTPDEVASLPRLAPHPAAARLDDNPDPDPGHDHDDPEETDPR